MFRLTVCAEAFNPDEDEEEKEPLVITDLLHTFLLKNRRLQRFPPKCLTSSLLDWQVTHPKTDEQRQRLQEACRDILLFKNLDPVSVPPGAPLAGALLKDGEHSLRLGCFMSQLRHFCC